MGEVLFMFGFVAAPLILWSFLLENKGRWYWFATMTWCLSGVLIAEAVSKLTNGHSISQLFWNFSDEHPIKAILALVCLWVGWSMLLLHLGWRMLKKKLIRHDPA